MKRRQIFSRKVISTLSITMIACCALVVFAIVSENKKIAGCVKRVAPNADLTDCSFFNADLHGMDLHGANLTNTNFSEANLSNANLQGAKLVTVDLKGSDLTGASLEGSTWNNVNLINAKGIDDATLSRWLAVPAGELSATLSKDLIRLETRDSILNLLGGQYQKGICEGIAFPDTADYSADASFHPILLIDSGTYKGSYEHPTTIEQWEPMAMRYASLAGCIGFQDQEDAGTCSYEDNFDVTATVYTLNIKLFASRTGQLITTIKVTGGDYSCPDKYVLGAGATGGISGPKVTMDEIKEALAPFVNPP